MEAEAPSTSSLSPPPGIDKGISEISIEELPPPAKIKHQDATNTVTTSATRRAWMPSRPRQMPTNQQDNYVATDFKNKDKQSFQPNDRMMMSSGDPIKETHHFLEERDGDGDFIDIVAQQQQQEQQQGTVMSIPHDEDVDHHPKQQQQQQQQLKEEGDQASSSSHPLTNNNLGSKPKLSNMSLLSSAVAHATLEQCLLGRNVGEEVEEEEEDEVMVAGGLLPDHNANTSLSSSSSPKVNNNNNNNKTINYSKQCKAGHIIDILELRRLSSRGVPDEPPEIRIAHHHNDGGPPPPPTSTATTMGLSHRSYRPLVWRVLLGYLPPQTSIWNMVLDRDRKLYDMLVQELFSSTCPAPHEYYLHEGGDASIESEVHVATVVPTEGINDDKHENAVKNGIDFVIGDDDDAADTNNCGAPSPSTPVESPADDTTSSTATITTTATTPLTTTPLTPGLLSARMQLEWIRGENGGEGAVFGQHPYSSMSFSSSARISPMCAMNTPRTRTFETTTTKSGSGVVVIEEDADEGTRSISEDIAADLADIEHSSSSSVLEGSSGDVDGVISHRFKESLLLPDQDDDDDDDDEEEEEEKGGIEEMNTIYVKSTIERDATLSNYEDARNSSRGYADDDEAVLPATAPKTKRSVSSPPDNDEEENILLLDEIRKDVIRTHPDLRFFLEPEEGLGQKRYAACERILFVWAKLNKGVRYVQGMNEIVGTLYFVLAHDSNEEWSDHAEADTYFLFNALMVEMRDVFVPALDEADTGIHGRINNMITLLSLHDPEMRCHLDMVGIDPSFYSVRWLTTLLSREFLLPDTIRLWDSMFASTHKDNFLRYVSVTMVMIIRDQLLSGDFSSCMRLLQAYPPTNLDRLLESSRALWIYESQITLACHKGGISLGHALRSIAPPPAVVMAYGLPGGVAPPIREQVRKVGERGLAAARGAANGASSTVVSAGRSFFGNAMSFWRDGSGSD